MNNVAEALIIAGSDSGGGAGVQADIKTMQACGVYSTNVIVAITAQNTLGVQDSLNIPVSLINAQFSSIFADFNIKAAKTGMLADRVSLTCVVENIIKFKINRLVVDPVMVAKGGAKLLNDDAIVTLKKQLLPLALITTPNLPEAQVIVGHKISNQNDIMQAAKEIQAMGSKNVIIKGGHDDKKRVRDFVLLENQKQFFLESERIETNRTHGTGDTLSSAITSALAKGHSVEEAIRFGRKVVTKTIEFGIIVGHGHGPLNHWAAEEFRDEI